MKDKFEEAIKEITEKIKNLLYIKAIVEDADKNGNEIWRMEAELAGKVIDKYLPKLINTIHQKAMKEAVEKAFEKGYQKAKEEAFKEEKENRIFGECDWDAG